MVWLEFLEKMASHLAWPVAALLIARQFREEIRQFLRRIKNAKYGGVEVSLEQEMQQIKASAQSAGITIVYPSSALSPDSVASIDAAPEWAFIKSWKEIENLIGRLYNVATATSEPGSISFAQKLKILQAGGNLDERLASVIIALHQTRNRIVHESNHSITRGEALEWLGIAKSIADRIRQRINSVPKS